MRLARRVPWAYLHELEELCGWIFTDANDRDAARRALDKLTAWRAITQLPHALDSTLSLLSAIHHDQTVTDGSQAASSNFHSTLVLRQSYASAIIRLVNGLVDPLQSGLYARPIAALAVQIGLPATLVEIRHAATHEELPSLEVLREAARESMTWLLHNYFLPTLSPPSVSNQQHGPIAPLSPLLISYKQLLKQTTRDASLTNQQTYRTQIAKILRDLERWLAQAKVAFRGGGSAVGAFSGSSNEDGRQEEEDGEKWALERLSEVLVEKGFLVPLSKKKRFTAKGSLALPPTLIALWQSLLEHIYTGHPSFPAVLLSAVLSSLASSPAEEGDFDTSFDMCLAGWALWLVERYENNELTTAEATNDSAINRKNTVSTLLLSISSAPVARQKILEQLSQALSADHPRLKSALDNLQPFLSRQNGVQPQKWQESDGVILADRLATLLASVSPTARPLRTSESNEARAPQTNEMSMDTTLEGPVLPQSAVIDNVIAPGWRLLDASSGWKPSPIGVFVAATIA